MKKQYIAYSVIMLVLIGILSISLVSAQTSLASRFDAVKAKIAAKFDDAIAKATNANVKQKLTDNKNNAISNVNSVQTAVSGIHVSASDIQSDIAAKKAAVTQQCNANPGKCKRS